MGTVEIEVGGYVSRIAFLVLTFGGTVCLIGSIVALVTGDLGAAVVLIILASGSGLLLNRLVGSQGDDG